MRPDDPFGPLDVGEQLDGDLIELAPEPDPDVLALTRTLEAAGVRARRGAPRPAESRPDREFEDRLLGELLDEGSRPRSSHPDGTRRTRVVGRVRSRSSGASFHGPSRRLVGLVAAVAIAAAAIVGTTGYLLRPPVIPVARATESVGGSIVRADIELPLTEGSSISVNDILRVAPGGRVTLELGGVWLRLAPGAAVRVRSVSDDAVVVDQLAGRVYHRVDPDRTARYSVAIHGIAVTARGTAFDISVEPDPEAGGTQVELLELVDAALLEGPGIAATIGEGHAAYVLVPTDQTRDPGLQNVAIDADLLLDPWLRENAELDQALGFPLGVLSPLVAAVASSTPPTSPLPDDPTRGPTVSAFPDSTPSMTQPPDATLPATSPLDTGVKAAPSARPATTSDPGAAGTSRPRPTAAPPTSRPTTPPNAVETPTEPAQPTPTVPPSSPPSTVPPSVAPAVGPLWLGVVGCNGAVVIDWSAYKGGGFARYVTLRNSVGVIPRAYPPRGGSVEIVRARSGAANRNSAFDPTARTGRTYFYRTLALGATGRVLAASPIVSAAGLGPAPADLGSLVGTRDKGAIRLAWQAFQGPRRCFDAYKIVASRTDRNPSWSRKSTVLATRASQSVQSIRLAGLPPGAYSFRVEAIVTTQLGGFVVARTSVLRVQIP